jgi:hypothetical protein
MIVFATLGPAGTNHELVTRRYIEFHGLADTRIELVRTFDDAVRGLQVGNVDFIVQCAVHPDTPRIMGENFRSLYVIDTFISPSKDLAILTRSEVKVPRTIALLRPATESYADLSLWPVLVSDISIPIILQKMLAGEYDSGLVYLEYANQYPGRFRIETVIGSPDDAWIVYGSERTYRDQVQAWRHSPAAALFAAKTARTAEQPRARTGGAT